MFLTKKIFCVTTRYQYSIFLYKGVVIVKRQNQNLKKQQQASIKKDRYSTT